MDGLLRAGPLGAASAGQAREAEAIAQAVGKQLGLDEVHAELLPDEKVAKIKALRAAGRRCRRIAPAVFHALPYTQSPLPLPAQTPVQVAAKSNLSNGAKHNP